MLTFLYNSRGSVYQHSLRLRFRKIIQIGRVSVVTSCKSMLYCIHYIYIFCHLLSYLKNASFFSLHTQCGGGGSLTDNMYMHFVLHLGLCTWEGRGSVGNIFSKKWRDFCDNPGDFRFWSWDQGIRFKIWRLPDYP